MRLLAKKSLELKILPHEKSFFSKRDEVCNGRMWITAGAMAEKIIQNLSFPVVIVIKRNFYSM